MSRSKKTAAAAAAAPIIEEHVDQAPATPPPVGRFELVRRTRIRPAEWNPRKIFDEEKIRELAHSVRVHGIGEPLLVRPIAGSEDLELVAGERRLRAAEIAYLEEVPVVIRELTDEQAFDLACIENGQRVDLHPLEEADAFAVKRDRFKRSIEEIAAQVAHTTTYVRQRLKLVDLVGSARKGFLDGRLSLAVALMVARIPDSKLQAEAAKELVNWRGGGDPANYNEARQFIQGRFMLDLSRATFPIADAQLVPEAGPCTTCLKRTGNQRELFADVASADVCTDPTCFEEKVDAAWKRKTDEAKSLGIKVVSASEAKSLWPDKWSGANFGKLGFTDLNASCYDDSKYRTYRQLLKNVTPAAIARNPHDGKVYELVETKNLGRLLKEAGHDFSKKKSSSSSSSSGNDSWRKKQEAERRAKALKKRVVEKAIALLVPAIEKGKADKEYFRLLARQELVGTNLYGHDELLKRRQIKNAKQVGSYIDGLSEAQLRGLLVEMAIGDGATGYKGEYSPTFLAACSLHKIDFKKFEADERAAEKAKEKPKAKKPAAKGKKAPATTGAKKKPAAAAVEDLDEGDEE